MNKATEIKTPPIRLFGNFVLLQGIVDSGNKIIVPTDLPGVSTAMKLHVAMIGDGERVAKMALAIGDEVELVQPIKEPTPANARFFPSAEQAYMLVGCDNILGVRTDGSAQAEDSMTTIFLNIKKRERHSRLKLWLERVKKLIRKNQ